MEVDESLHASYSGPMSSVHIGKVCVMHVYALIMASAETIWLICSRGFLENRGSNHPAGIFFIFQGQTVNVSVA